MNKEVTLCIDNKYNINMNYTLYKTRDYLVVLKLGEMKETDRTLKIVKDENTIMFIAFDEDGSKIISVDTGLLELTGISIGDVQYTFEEYKNIHEKNTKTYVLCKSSEKNIEYKPVCNSFHIGDNCNAECSNYIDKRYIVEDKENSLVVTYDETDNTMIVVEDSMYVPIEYNRLM